jgi:polysaccharide biosynthesis PFTS motif protein
MTRLLTKVALSILRNKKSTSSPESKKSYRFGVTVVAGRQLEGNKRGPDFIVDDKKIPCSDVVYFPLVALSKEQKKRLHQLKSDVFYISNKEGNFSLFPSWKRLLLISLQERCLRNADVVSDAYLALAEYFTWQRLMTNVEIKHFITHCDMGVAHIARNIALEQSGVQTWYFTDSMNSGLNMCQNGDKSGERHPFFTYLYYDHLVAWHELLANFYANHPGSFKQTHVVGCLWGDHIVDRKSVKVSLPYLITSKTTGSKAPFTIVFFDSTYTRNTRTSYEEGVAFARHLLQLADEYPDIMIVLKEKKNRTIHTILDSLLGPRLLALYEKMDTHPRIKTFIDKFDSSDLISNVDMVVSFPFTSTTFEALSRNKPAIWHDPMGYYRNTPYGNLCGVTTHNYEELKTKILEIKGMEPGTFQNPIPMVSPLMDPYRDGKAIDRFRDLLVSH